MQVQIQSRRSFLGGVAILLLWMTCVVSGQNITDAPATLAPATGAPETSAPVTDAPITAAPVTLAPATDAPVTEAPATDAPITSAPVTDAPVTLAPVTDAPVTLAPVTDAPVTAAPATDSPVTLAPVSPAPVTPAPITGAPVSPAPITPNPSEFPSETPSGSSSESPSEQPSESPSEQPSWSPSEMPSESPSAMPSNSSTGNTTTAPTMAPTGNETMTPSGNETMVPTGNETIPPTMPPTGNETMAPTGNETMPPGNETLPPFTDAPSEVPSEMPSETPSSMPSETPSSVPTSTTAFPTEAMSGAPTAAPSEGKKFGTVTGARMTMTGISGMDDATTESYEVLTKMFSEDFFEMMGTVDAYTTEIEVTDVIPASRRLRGLQTPEVTVVYDQQVEYRSNNPLVDPEFLVAGPFEKEETREEYTNFLVASEVAGFADLEGVTAVDVPEPGDTPAPTSSPTSSPSTTPPAAKPTDAPEPADDEGGLSTGAIIGIAVAGGVALILCLLAVFFMSGGEDDDKANFDAPEVVGTTGGDEVSTLAPPANTAGATGNESLADGGYGDQSVATVDYDYSKAYGGGGDTSVSSAGGTFGSNTQGLSQGENPNAAAPGAALGGAGSFSDGESLEGQYRDPNASVKEDLINIFAPPGKLGVVIDTPDDGAPVVHAVKDSSIIADKIKVGDKLVAVDDEDVRSMTAIKVSKLISRKSSNPTRKLTVIRTTVAE